MKSMLMTSIPRYDLVAPPAAIGILQGVAKDNGIHAEVFDFNLFLKQNLTELEWQELDDWCIFVKHDICDALKSKIIIYYIMDKVDNSVIHCKYGEIKCH